MFALKLTPERTGSSHFVEIQLWHGANQHTLLLSQYHSLGLSMEILLASPAVPMYFFPEHSWYPHQDLYLLQYYLVLSNDMWISSELTYLNFHTSHPDPGLLVICALLGTWTPWFQEVFWGVFFGTMMILRGSGGPRFTSGGHLRGSFLAQGVICPKTCKNFRP